MSSEQSDVGMSTRETSILSSLLQATQVVDGGVLGIRGFRIVCLDCLLKFAL